VFSDHLAENQELLLQRMVLPWKLLLGRNKYMRGGFIIEFSELVDKFVFFFAVLFLSG